MGRSLPRNAPPVRVFVTSEAVTQQAPARGCTNETSAMSNEKIDTWMPMFWGDYFKRTRGFSAAEHGAYLCLLGEYWLRGGPLPDDREELKRLACLTGRCAEKTLNRALSKFKLVGRSWHHERVDAELEKARANKAKCAERGKKGARGRWLKHTPSIEQAMPEQCLADGSSPSPSPTHLKSTSNENVVGEKPEKRKPKPKPEPAPILEGTTHFRITPSELENARKQYRIREHPEDLIPFAIREVDDWLAGETPGAILARKSPTHVRQLYATWVIERALRARRIHCGGPKNGTHGPPRNESGHERTMRVLNEELEKERARKNGTSGNDSVFETTWGAVPEPSSHG